jgi:ribosomal protein S18 acetylase RimI-like enzyme
MEIRPALISDAAALARVHVDSWRAAYGGLVPDSSLRRFTYEWREERFREAIAAHAEETYVVQQDEQVVGFLTLGAARDADMDVSLTGEIWGIYISPKYWRKGIGRKVAQEAETVLKSRGYKTIVLWVLEDNRQARQFYAALGFEPDGASRIIDWGTPLKAVRYRKAV